MNKEVLNAQVNLWGAFFTAEFSRQKIPRVVFRDSHEWHPKCQSTRRRLENKRKKYVRVEKKKKKKTNAEKKSLQLLEAFNLCKTCGRGNS